jgi:1,2-diacylglycerol 3-alpha-glucosyltransferase
MPGGGIFGLMVRRWFNLVSKLSTCVISPGERMKQQLHDYGIKKDIVIIPNAVEMEKFDAPFADDIRGLKARFGIKEHELVLIYIGRLSKEKNLEFLIRSLRELLTAEDNLKLLFVGDGKTKAGLESQTRALGLENKVVFTGYVPYEEVHGYYFLGDIFVTASLSEVFPLTIIEALSCSLPVVAIDAVGTGDIVRHGYNGILVKEDEQSFRDGVKTLVDDAEMRRRMGENAQESVRALSVDRCVEEHLALYQRHSVSK